MTPYNVSDHLRCLFVNVKSYNHWQTAGISVIKQFKIRNWNKKFTLER